MELFKYYSLEEVIDRELILDKLEYLKSDGKIEYELDSDIIRIDDLDLEDSDIEEMLYIFEEYDVFPYLDREDDSDDDFDIYDDDFDEYDY